MTDAQKIFDSVFNDYHRPTSEAYRRGALEAIEVRLVGAPTPSCPYTPGTAEADAYLAGVEEGNDVAAGSRPRCKMIPVKDIQLADVRKQAIDFYHLANLAMNPTPNGIIVGPFVAYVVCMAFSVEIWFKALYCQKNPEGKIPNGHNLYKIFKLLPIDIQEEIIEHCNMSSKGFMENLKLDAKTFETWRYSYEYNAGTVGPRYPLRVNNSFLIRISESCHQIFDTQRY